MVPIRGTDEAIRKLAHAGHHPVVLTNRGGLYFEVARAWIETMRWSVKTVSVGKGRSKAPAAVALGLIAYVDDDAYKLRDLVGLVEHVFFFEQPYNRHEVIKNGITRVSTWEELFTELTARGVV